MKSFTVVCILLAVASVAFSQDSLSAKRIAVSVRIGDPIGLTFKKYFKRRFAAEVTFGKTLGDEVISSPASDPYPFPEEDVHYVYSSSARFLMQVALPESSKGSVHVYFGGGPQLLWTKVTYHYTAGTNAGEETTETAINVGIETLGGMEYRFEKTPLILYGETSLAWLLMDGGYSKVWRAVGARFLF